ncbi:hypothetical protein HMPREF0322_05372 [Desulfitobacterium hafniense DP7]|uniref:Uncharacterized protein n=1 Tax=Desulfitobacterium hafniense DP7 TaxID=537010 RepID=G9XWK5_DESHA|nr:hypothetical protein HMPREF0322_05372 [Desulfitobacterium hafniense DP7]
MLWGLYYITMKTMNGGLKRIIDTVIVKAGIRVIKAGGITLCLTK